MGGMERERWMGQEAAQRTAERQRRLGREPRETKRAAAGEAGTPPARCRAPCELQAALALHLASRSPRHGSSAVQHIERWR